MRAPSIFLWSLILLVSCSQPNSDEKGSEKKAKAADDDDTEDSEKKKSKKRKKKGASSASSSATEAPPPPPKAAIVEESCAELAVAVCTKYESCHHGYEIRWKFGDVPACKAAVASQCLDLVQAPDSAAGAAEVAACTQTVSQGDCLGPSSVGACRFKGKRAGDAACAVGSQCQTGVCRKDHGKGCGKCLGPMNEGDACKQWNDCGFDLACNKGKCTPFAAPGGDCTKNFYCSGGTFCTGGTCKPAPKEGEKCVKDSEIVGEDCTYQYTCSNATSTCEPKKLSAPGDQCGFGTFCGNSTCNFKTSKCVPLLKEGDACTDTYECAQPLECADKKCVMPGKGQCN